MLVYLGFLDVVFEWVLTRYVVELFWVLAHRVCGSVVVLL